jgi:hypothetical protein
MCGNASASNSALYSMSVETVFEAVTADARLRNQTHDDDVDEVCGVMK